jgi:hypothetical protein
MVFTSSGRSWKKLGVWFIPVIGIPLLWPAYAMSIGGLDEWLEGFFWQASGRIDRPLWMALEILFEINPVLLIIGSVGILIAAFKRDFFFIMGRTIPCTFASFRICFILVLHSNFACIRCRKRLAYRKGSPTCSQSK